MKIEDKRSEWDCGHKSTQRGNIARCWRDVHKKARGTWKHLVYRKEYELLMKRC
jgi:hypothetical protein